MAEPKDPSAGQPASVSSAALHHVEVELYAYPATARALEERRRDIIEAGMSASFLGQSTRHRGSHFYDPTGIRGSQLVEHLQLRELTRITDAIEAVVEQLAPDVRRLVELWFWQRRPLHEVCTELGISRESAYRWRRGVLVAVAGRLGWM